MFKGLGNIASMIKQAQTMGPKMQAKMEELAQKRVTGSAGGGMVTVVASGNNQILSVNIDPLLAEKQDLEMVTDLLPAAINDALEKAKQLHMEAMQSVTEDFEMPGNMEGMLGKLFGGDLTGSDDDSPAGGPPSPPTA